jgi:hypothetical protein
MCSEELRGPHLRHRPRSIRLGSRILNETLQKTRNQIVRCYAANDVDQELAQSFFNGSVHSQYENGRIVELFHAR